MNETNPPLTWIVPLAALRQARANRLQNSPNLVLGSSLVSIGLTIPDIAAVSIGLGKPIELGITAKDTVLQGAVHLVIFAAYRFLAVVP